MSGDSVFVCAVAVERPRLKDISKPIFAILGCTTAFALGQEAPLPANAVSPDVNPLLDLGPNSDVLPVPMNPEFAAVSELPPSDSIPRAVKAAPTERKWKVIPFAGFEVSWTDNLFASAIKRRSDFFSIISPGLAGGWGDFGGEIQRLGGSRRTFDALDLAPDTDPKNFIFARYNLNASFFAKNDDQNSVDHDALISARWEGAKLTLGVRFYFQTLSDLNIEVGSRVDRKIYGADVSATYAFTGKTSAEVNLRNRNFDYPQQVSWREWMVEGWGNYQLAPKVKVSFGTRLGLVKVESAPMQTFEQLVGRLAYSPSSKLGFNLDGGVEWRQYGQSAGDEVFGVFNFSGTYQPFDGTQLAVNAYRRNSASVLLSDENITATGLFGAAAAAPRAAILLRCRMGLGVCRLSGERKHGRG